MTAVEKLTEVHILPDGRLFIKVGRVFYYKKDLDAWLRRAVRVASTQEARRQQADTKQAKAATLPRGDEDAVG
jgi:hypothetical protein